MLDLSLIEEATRVLRDKVRRTPVELSPILSALVGAPVHLKLENLQVTGSFKVRGAIFRLALLTSEERARGVATCSAGNHGKGVAHAAAALGIAATVYAPQTVDEAKHRGMTALGANVVRSSFPGYDDTLSWALEQARASGHVFVSAFEDDAVMAGNGGTLAAEVLEQVPAARRFVLPVGGGGLAAGFVARTRASLPGAVIVAVQHEESPGLLLSLERGVAVTRLPAVATLASGVEGGIGARNFELLRGQVDQVALVSEEAIREATVWMLEEHQYLVEPTGAVTVAACLSGQLPPSGDPTVVVVSGRNVARPTMARLLGAR